MKTRPVTYFDDIVGSVEIYEFGPKAGKIKQVTLTDVEHIEYIMEAGYFYVDLDDDEDCIEMTELL